MVILFGEHSVVYGRTAVAATLGRRTTVTVTPSNNGLVLLLLPAVQLPRAEAQLPQDENEISATLEDSILNIKIFTDGATPQLLSRLSWWADWMKRLSVSKEALQSVGIVGYLHSVLCPAGMFGKGFKVQVNSELKPGAGTGSSAAYSVALAAALAKHARLEFDVAQIEKLAWKAEHIVHGTPSGLDTAISSQGGIVQFSRAASGELKFVPSALPRWPLRILLVDSGVKRNTKKMVQCAKDCLESIQGAREPLLDTMDQVALAALSALQEEQSAGYPRLENLVTVNQGLLCALGVSHPALNAICSTAARHNLCAKLTGAGGGGNAFVLLQPNFTSNKLTCLQEDLQSQRFNCTEETLFGPGVRLESS